MAKAPRNAIEPTRAEDYPEWYQQVIKAAELAETSPVRGCMVIKPWGWALWENVQRVLDRMFKDTGHVNAYFPLFIPKSFLEKEAEHVEGFAKECAVVTHHRLVEGPEGGLIPDPEAKLEEPLIVRPTSETIIGSMYAKWVQSYRDLPILINQWANVVRWELRTRMFLRTAEFLWQEGHTAHATEEEALAETRQMLDVYATFAEEWMAMPVIKGEKTPGERFPGAVATYSIEAMMQDRRALQAGTSHFLGQNFAKAQEIKFLSSEGKEEFAWTTSWGVSTRLIGGLIMTHSDDDGLVVPPRLAPKHVVLMPIYRNDEERGPVLEYCQTLKRELEAVAYPEGAEGVVRVELDDRDIRGGEKNWQHVKRGVPLRVEIGPRDVEGDVVTVARRDLPPKEKATRPRAEFVKEVVSTLQDMQRHLFEQAATLRAENSRKFTDRKKFEKYFTPKNEERPEIHGGFAIAGWSPAPEDQPKIEEQLKAQKLTIRCVPEPGELQKLGLDVPESPGRCLLTGIPTDHWAIYAKAY